MTFYTKSIFGYQTCAHIYVTFIYELNSTDHLEKQPNKRVEKEVGKKEDKSY